MSDDIPITELPVPPLAAVVVVPATASATDRDVASDLAEEKRVEEPPLPPPGTTLTKFTESSGFKVAVGSTIALGLVFAKALILAVPVSREAVALGVENLTWMWAFAFGISKIDTSSLRWK